MSDIFSKSSKQIAESQLAAILRTMDVPVQRNTDLRWLNRNLGVRNSTHPRFKEAMELIKEIQRD